MADSDKETKAENEEGWISVMDMETSLLEVDIGRSQGFLPSKPPGDKEWRVQHIAPKTPFQTEKLVLNKDHPFQGLSIASTDPFNEQTQREHCPMCMKSRKFFCYTCYVCVESLQPHVPNVKLPIKIDIVKHKREVEGKSTAVHAPILAPRDVKMYDYPDIPDYTKEKALLVFPGKKSRTLSEILEEVQKSAELSGKAELEGETPFPYDKIVFIDSTWNQCKGMLLNQSLAAMPCVIISSRETIFWRYQKGKPKEYLATIEAIYYFLVDFHQIVLKADYSGEYDNMLFFFKFMYDKIHELYEHDQLRAYTRD